jgi:hypothetical protein
MSTNYSPTIVTDGAVFVGDARMPSISEPGTRLYDRSGVDSTAVKLLIHGDVGSGQSFADSSLSNIPIVAVGDVTHSTAESKFSGGSIFFDGTGDYLNVGSSNATYTDVFYDVNGLDFTYDFWVYRTGSGRRGLISSHTGPGYDDIEIEFTAANQIMGGYRTTAMAFLAVTTTTALAVDTWYHVALVRQSGILKIYLNGILEDTDGTTYTGDINNRGGALLVGFYSTLYHQGYMDEIRITIGSALWTQNFTPPARRDTLSISDGMMYNGSCISLDGGDENVNCGNASDLDVTTGSFTIIGWINNNDIGNYDVIVQKGNAGHGSSPGYRLRWEGVTDLNKLMFICTQSSSYAEDNVLTADALAQDTWYQVAITRNAGLLSIYIDGALNNSKSTAITGTLTNSEHFVLGYDKYNDSAYFNGQMADWKFFNVALSADQVK